MIRTAALALVAFALAAPANAEVHWTLGAASDHVVRGVGRTDDQARLYGGLDAFAGDLYAGGRLGTADVGGADAELNLYVGFQPEVAGWLWDFSVARTAYLDAPSGSELDYWDGAAQVSRSVGPVWGALVLGWSPDYLGPEEETWWVGAKGEFELTPRVAATADVGRQESDLADHVWWSAGAEFALTDRIALGLKWWDTDAHALGDAYEGRLVFGLESTF